MHRLIIIALLLTACGGRASSSNDCAALTAQLQPPPNPALLIGPVHATVGHTARQSFREALRIDDGSYRFHVKIVFSELARAGWATDDLWTYTPAPVDVGAWPMRVDVLHAQRIVETRTVPLCVSP